MNAKRAVTIGLLLFVAASVLVLVAKGLRQDSAEALASSQTDASGGRVIAYFFHTNMRCVKCRKMESYAHEAIQTGFADELQQGTVSWNVVNYEQPANAHYKDDYQLITSAVVLVRMSDGASTEWKDLRRVWELVEDKDQFIQYVKDETRALLTGSGESPE